MKKFFSAAAIAAVLTVGAPKANAGILLMTPLMLSAFSETEVPAWASASALVGSGVFAVGYVGKHLPFINPALSVALIVLEENGAANQGLIAEAIAARFPHIDDFFAIERLSAIAVAKIQAGEVQEIGQGLREVVLNEQEVKNALESSALSREQIEEVASFLSESAI